MSGGRLLSGFLLGEPGVLIGAILNRGEHHAAIPFEAEPSEASAGEQDFPAAGDVAEGSPFPNSVTGSLPLPRVPPVPSRSPWTFNTSTATAEEKRTRRMQKRFPAGKRGIEQPKVTPVQSLAYFGIPSDLTPTRAAIRGASGHRLRAPGKRDRTFVRCVATGWATDVLSLTRAGRNSQKGVAVTATGSEFLLLAFEGCGAPTNCLRSCVDTIDVLSRAHFGISSDLTPTRTVTGGASGHCPHAPGAGGQEGRNAAGRRSSPSRLKGETTNKGSVEMRRAAAAQ